MKTFKKPYVLIVANGDYGYIATEYDSINEALLVDKYTADWAILKAVTFEVKDITETSPLQ